jgi:hypothetical protein
MKVADEAQRQREARCQAVPHRMDVVRHLARLGAVLFGRRQSADFSPDELLRGSDRPFDPTRENGIPVEQRRRNQEGVDRAADGAHQAADCMVGVGEQPDALVVKRQLGREGVRDERRHAGPDGD